MEGCKPTYTPGVGAELSLNQPEEKLLVNEEEKRRYQAITGAVIYLAQVTCYDILYVPFRAESHPLESNAWQFRTQQGYFWFWHCISDSDVSRYFFRGFYRRRLLCQ